MRQWLNVSGITITIVFVEATKILPCEIGVHISSPDFNESPLCETVSEFVTKAAILDRMRTYPIEQLGKNTEVVSEAAPTPKD